MRRFRGYTYTSIVRMTSRPRLLASLFPNHILAVPCGILALVILTGCAAPIVKRTIEIDPATLANKLENYRLGPGDIVQVSVFQEEDMLSVQRVGQDGTINFPLVGRVKIGGQTVEQAAQSISSKLQQGFLVNPQVTVSINEYAPRRFTIYGQVNGAGSYEIPSEEIVSLATAVAMAGGNTRIGNLRKVTVTRNAEEGIVEYQVNLLTPTGRQFIIENHDLITVPESLF